MRKLSLLNLLFLVWLAGCGTYTKSFLDWNTYAVSAENLDDNLVNPQSFRTLTCLPPQPWYKPSNSPEPCPDPTKPFDTKKDYVGSVVYDSEVKCGQFLDRLVLSDTGENTFL